MSADKVPRVDRWRKGARRAGWLLGWRVRTGVIADGARIWAAALDYPVTEVDRREAAAQVESLLFGERRAVERLVDEMLGPERKSPKAPPVVVERDHRVGGRPVGPSELG